MILIWILSLVLIGLWFLDLPLRFGYSLDFSSVEARKYVDSMVRLGGLRFECVWVGLRLKISQS